VTTADRFHYRAQLERLAEAVDQRTQPIAKDRHAFVLATVASRSSEQPTQKLPRFRA
jgi:hypothetical protein